MAPTTASVKSRENDLESKEDRSISSPSDSSLGNVELDERNGVVVAARSRGVQQMIQLKDRLDTKYRVLLYGGFALLAYIMSLDQYTNRSYLTAATSVSFAAHSTVTTIATIKSVMQSVSQPPVAKLADGAGRLEAYAVCLFLYCVGYAIQASSRSIYQFAAGNAIYIPGITGLFLLQNIIISDISSLRNRLFWSIFPSLPGTINVWVSGDITQSLLGSKNETANMWRWGIGMFAILTPALAIPIMITLGVGMRKHKVTSPKFVPVAKSGPQPSFAKKALSVFWQLDLIGLLLLVAGAGMFLVTITIANGRGSSWSDAHCIVLLVLGGVCLIGFILWERFGARHPLIPFTLLTNRTVIVCMLVAVIHPAAGGVIGSYFYTFLIVAGGQTTKSAQRITSLASFSGTWAAAFFGIVVRYTRHLKPIIIFGFIIEVLAFGLMIRYRDASSSQADLAIVQLVRGLGVGAIGFPVQAAIQSVSKHEHLAAITAGYLTIYYLAGGIGSAIGGSIWTNYLPGHLLEYTGNQTLADELFKNPVGAIAKYPVGTLPRDALNRAQGEAQRILGITGCSLAAVGLVVVFFLQNVRLGDEQSLESVENDESPVNGEAKQSLTRTERLKASLGLGPTQA